jgi:hypothetical protein
LGKVTHGVTSAADLLIRSCMRNQFYYAGNYFEMVKGIFGLFYVLKKKRLEKQSVDFSKDLINLSRRVEKIKIVLRK